MSDRPLIPIRVIPPRPLAIINIKGGPGSGHHGHGGLSGVHGGSRPSGASSARETGASSGPLLGAPSRQLLSRHRGVSQALAKSMDLDGDPSIETGSKITLALAEAAGLSPKTVAETTLKWIGSSNQSPTSRTLQAAVAKEFDAPLSAWQKESFAERLAEKPPSYALVTGAFESPKEAEKLARAVYEETQTELAEMGYEPDDEIVLYRGIATDEYSEADLGVADYKGNAVESWTLLRRVATQFAEYEGEGIMVVASVPVSAVFAVPSVGLASSGEKEVIVF